MSPASPLLLPPRIEFTRAALTLLAISAAAAALASVGSLLGAHEDGRAILNLTGLAYLVGMVLPAVCMLSARSALPELFAMGSTVVWSIRGLAIIWFLTSVEALMALDGVRLAAMELMLLLVLLSFRPKLIPTGTPSRVRRDFTCFALAFSALASLVDQFGLALALNEESRRVFAVLCAALHGACAWVLLDLGMLLGTAGPPAASEPASTPLADPPASSAANLAPVGVISYQSAADASHEAAARNDRLALARWGCVLLAIAKLLPLVMLAAAYLLHSSSSVGWYLQELAYSIAFYGASFAVAAFWLFLSPPVGHAAKSLPPIVRAIALAMLLVLAAVAYDDLLSRYARLISPLVHATAFISLYLWLPAQRTTIRRWALILLIAFATPEVLLLPLHFMFAVSPDWAMDFWSPMQLVMMVFGRAQMAGDLVQLVSLIALVVLLGRSAPPATSAVESSLREELPES